MEALNAEIRNLEKKYIDELPFHVNDKIKFKGEFLGWVSSVHPFTSDMVELWFYPPKKNGEQSNSRRILYLTIKDIEVIND